MIKGNSPSFNRAKINTSTSMHIYIYTRCRRAHSHILSFPCQINHYHSINPHFYIFLSPFFSLLFLSFYHHLLSFALRNQIYVVCIQFTKKKIIQKLNLNGINKTRRPFGSHISSPTTGPGGSKSKDQLEFIPSVSL